MLPRFHHPPLPQLDAEPWRFRCRTERGHCDLRHRRLGRRRHRQRPNPDPAVERPDEISQGCSTNDQSDASYQAATVPDDHATTYKKAFAALWTAIAKEYGLPLYQYNQI
jgi:hypothetical protein